MSDEEVTERRSAGEGIGKAGTTVKEGIVGSLKGINEIEAEIVSLVRNTVSDALKATGTVALGGSFALQALTLAVPGLRNLLGIAPIRPLDGLIIGGAALSGKDPTRIDRIGAYVARYAAKNVVAAGLAGECEVQLSYSIGLSRPVSVQVETFGTGQIPDAEIATLLEHHFDFRLAGIIRQFNLRALPSTVKGGFYRKLAAYGHVGRMDIGLPWEVTDQAPVLRSAIPVSRTTP